MKHWPSHLGANLSPFFIGLRESIFSSDGEFIDSSDSEESSESSELLMLAILSIQKNKAEMSIYDIRKHILSIKMN